MKLLCDDCRSEIKIAPVRDDCRRFCDSRCHQQWKRRLARFRCDQQKPVAFGDA